MPSSKLFKKKHAHFHPKARCSGNPTVRRAEEEAARAQVLARSERSWDAGPFTGFPEERIDQEAMDHAKADAKPVIAELVAAGMRCLGLRTSCAAGLARCLPSKTPSRPS